MLCIASCRRSDETGLDNDDTHTCNKSSASSVTVSVGVEGRVDAATRSPGPGAEVRHLSTTRHPGTVRGLCYPRASSSTSSRASSTDGITSPDVYPRPDSVGAGDVGRPSSTSTSSGDHLTAFRPGRFTNIEILKRIFPRQRQRVLDLVLTGCNGDLVKAIEQCLFAQDPSSAQHGYQLPQQQHQQLQRVQNVAASSHCRSMLREGDPEDAGGLSVGNDGIVGSSLSAPNQRHATSVYLPSAALGLQSAVSPRPATLTTAALLGPLTPGLPPPPLQSRQRPIHPPPPLDHWSPSPAGAGFASPTSPNPILLGHRPYEARVPPSALHGSLVDHYVQMMVAAAAAALGQATPSSASAGLHETRPALATTSRDDER